MRRALICLLLVAAACSQPQARPAISPTATPSTSPTLVSSPVPGPTSNPTPTTSRALLFAVLEAKGTASFNTVAIAGLDGYAKAKATFTPMRVPTVGCTGTAVPPLSAHVAAGKVYFA